MDAKKFGPHLTTLPYLSISNLILELSHNPIEAESAGVLGFGLASLSNLRELELSLTEDAIVDLMPKLSGLADLDILYLSDSQIGVRAASALGCALFNLSGLSQLYLLQSQICVNSAKILASYFSDVFHLIKLDLSDCQIENAAIIALAPSLYHLISLVLTSLPPEIGNLAGLTHLNLQGCSRLTSLPTEIGNLTGLTDLSIS